MSPNGIYILQMRNFFLFIFSAE